MAHMAKIRVKTDCILLYRRRRSWREHGRQSARARRGRAGAGWSLDAASRMRRATLHPGTDKGAYKCGYIASSAFV